MSLSFMQQRYVWLAGSHPDKIVVQGRGKRSRKLLYGIDGDELVVFGYSNPMQWLVHRDLFRPLQALNTFTMTGAGEDIFIHLQARGAGFKLNGGIQQVRVARRPEDQE